MKFERSFFIKLVVSFLLIVFVNINLLAQTPADDPNIGGPGAGAAPAGDGSPIVPLDTNLNLGLLIVSVYYFSKKLNRKLI